MVVGSGIAGAMLVRQLADQGHRILIIEAGVADNMSLQGFQEYVQRFQSSSDKHPNSPFPKNQNVPSPTALGDYFVEAGPMPLGGSYTRAFGGTTLHWEGKALRMLREDLETSSRYGVGLNWPITYD
ncbi:MAG: NAD(P)-binding protein, partial [bacterium]